MNSTGVASFALTLLLGLYGCADDEPVGSAQSSGPSTGPSTVSPSPNNPAVIASNAVGQLVQIGGAGEDAFAIVATSGPKFGRGVSTRGSVLSLTSGRCIGLSLPSKPYAPAPGTPVQEVIVVWPQGTTFSVKDGKISVTSEGQTVAIGDKIEGGISLTQLGALADLLPQGCDLAQLRQVGIGS